MPALGAGPDYPIRIRGRCGTNQALADRVNARPIGVDFRASATPGAQDDVGDVPVIGRRVDARLDRLQLDREFVLQ